MNYFTSDTHFGHKLVAGLRGFDSPDDHDAALIDAWNSAVTKADVVYHLGDFMLPQRPDYADSLLRTLNGTKVLIRGNHDRRNIERLDGWAAVVDYKHKRIRHGFHVVMFHYAMRTWEHMHHGSFHLYGHSHGSLASGYGRSMDVGVDTRVDWTPWSEEEVYGLLEDNEVLKVDHHVEGEEVEVE